MLLGVKVRFNVLKVIYFNVDFSFVGCLINCFGFLVKILVYKIRILKFWFLNFYIIKLNCISNGGFGYIVEE